MTSADTKFIETKQYQRFKEFCDACRTYQYIGLCYGVPGVGKTVSARHYTNPDKVWPEMLYLPSEGKLDKGPGNTAVLYTPSVTNSPGQIGRDLGSCRSHFTSNLLRHLEKKEKPKLRELEENMEIKRRAAYRSGAKVSDEPSEEFCRERDAYFAARNQYFSRRSDIRDAPMLLMIDEADRLKMGSLEQVRAIFDQGGIGLVLIGMPGLEKRLARYPQLYSRVGFVHEFKPLSQAEVRQLLRQGWLPFNVRLPDEALIDEKPLLMLIRIADGKFRLLYRLLQQIGRFMEVNRLDKLTCQVVEAARETLVIGSV